MPTNLHIYYDEPQEGTWFQELHPYLQNVELSSITQGKRSNPLLANVLAYDKPDVILTHADEPILVVERTIEVPSGHNVGQRFARLAAAAEAGIPSVYFGPYVARKHGGDTEGPRWMNLRLFHALEKLIGLTGSAALTINWPVDEDYEVVTNDPAKDDHMRSLLATFFLGYEQLGKGGINQALLTSRFYADRLIERRDFANNAVRNPGQYDDPPDSVKFMTVQDFGEEYQQPVQSVDHFNELVVYDIGSTYLRSDPYTGMGLLYKYLYVLGEPQLQRGLILHFPELSVQDWLDAANARRARKDIKLFRLVADGVLFRDGFLDREAVLA